MNKPISKLDLVLRTFKVVVPYYGKDGKELGYRFNLLNPIGYIILLPACIGIGFMSGLDTLLTTITDSMSARLTEIKVNKEANELTPAKKQ